MMVNKSLVPLMIASLVLLLFSLAGCGENGQSSDSPKDIESAVDITPPVISGIMVSDVIAKSVNITWNTDEEATSQVNYGNTKNYEFSTILDINLVTNHIVTLDNLEPLTTYYFSVISKDEFGNESISEERDFTTKDLLPAQFSLSNFSIDPKKASVWENVSVTSSAHLYNDGDIEGTYTVILRVNGIEEKRQDYVVAGKTTKEISLTTEIIKTAGLDCVFEMGGETATLVIEEGVRRPLNIGDQWTLSVTVDTHFSLYPTITTQVTATMAGETSDSNGYILELTSNDAKFNGTFEGTMTMDKKTMLPIEMVSSGKYLGVFPYDTQVNYSHNILEGERFPLVVGNEYKVQETVAITGTGYPETYTNEIYCYKVEGIESKVVQGKTYRCFKVVKYQQDGVTEIGTSWVADKVKQWPVKTEGIDPLWELSELVSFTPA